MASSAAPPPPPGVAADAEAPTTSSFDPRDPKYMHGCGACRVHTTSYAKLFIIVYSTLCSFITIVAIRQHEWLVVPIPLALGILITLLGLKENRVLFILLAVVNGLAAMCLTFLLFGLVIASCTTLKENGPFVKGLKQRDRESAKIFMWFLVVVLVPVVLFFFWTVSVFVKSYRFLRDRAASGTVPVYYEVRNGTTRAFTDNSLAPSTSRQQQQPRPEWDPKKTAHMDYPRDAPVAASAPSAPVPDTPPPAYPSVYPQLEQTANREFGWKQ